MPWANDLANYMAGHLMERAHLVSDEKAKDHAFALDSIPPFTGVRADFLNMKSDYDVEKLFKPKKFASLACGPDTISHRLVNLICREAVAFGYSLVCFQILPISRYFTT